MTAKLGPMGWVPPEARTVAQHEAHERAMSLAEPQFHLEGTYRDVKGRFPLWKALQKVLNIPGQTLPYNWQVTGSCVGASGGNIAKTIMAVEICAGELEEWKVLWWPFTYGRSRFRAGMLTPGEGSFGSAYAEAATRDGFLAVTDKEGLPAFSEKEGWIQISGQTEYAWSDGDAPNVMACMDLARLHLMGKFVKIRSYDEAKAALANGKGLICASMFGTRGPVKRGSRYPIYVAEWDDRWPHQMFIDEAWDHEEVGPVLRYGNNWGPKAHKEPTQGEPWGGFYMSARTFDSVCQSRDAEVIAFEGLSGWRVRELNFFD